MTLIGPQYLGRITDTLSYAILNGTDVDMDVIYGCVIILLFLYIGAALLTFTQNYLISVLSERIAAKMRKDLSRKFDQLPLRYLDGRTTGELMSYMVNDTQVISNGCSESIIHTVNAVMMMAGTIVMMLYTNVFITGFALAPVAASIVMVLLIIRGTQKYFRAQQEMLSRINGLVEEAYSGHVINRLYNNQGRLARRFGEFN
ncbi:MAG: ABC transporter ATP-binding protein, partial [Candidatus Methanomethylophilaceae archaeon]|nr:ABC transporter ATP-binding protein [Candidatus Methanomethylophilaceae archaeon]